MQVDARELLTEQQEKQQNELQKKLQRANELQERRQKQLQRPKELQEKLQKENELQKKLPLGLYVHIPFCVRKCAYCDFLSAPADEETRARYVERLKQEIREAAGELSSRYAGATVFFGGGTPSLLEGGQLAELLAELDCGFSLKNDAEITVECNPGTLDSEKLEIWRRAGVNRLSIGLQSANNAELRLLGRIHTWEEFLTGYDLARRASFANINVDLMSALPGQTREDWLGTLERVTALEPEHISAYSLMIEEETPFWQRYGPGSPGEALLPDEDTERQIYADTKAYLQEKGYRRYEISNYAKPGFACRHNLSYWERTAYRGFGIGAASLVGSRRFTNGSRLADYLKGENVLEEVQTLTRQEELEETMFLGLRKMEGVALTPELERTYAQVFARLENQGLLVQEQGRVRLTDQGIDVSNIVLAEFLL